MMLVLTKDRQSRSQLSLLLRDLGYKPVFHQSVDAFLDELSAHQSTLNACLVDTEVHLDAAAIERLRGLPAGTKLIAYERYSAQSETKAKEVPDVFALTIILPNHAERAKSRLKNALRQTSPAAGSMRTVTRAPFPRKRPLGERGGKLNWNRLQSAPPPASLLKARYVVNESAAANALVHELKKQSAQMHNILLTGDDEAEFELIARELNFQSNQDHTPMEVIQVDDLSIDYLQGLERQANKAKQPTLAYVGRIDDLNENAALELGLFVEFLANLRNPHLRLILAHLKGTEEFCQAGVMDHFNAFRRQLTSVRVPRLVDRPEDIPSICQTLIGSMRAAHPFLLVGRISSEAVTYLSESREDYSYTKLIRILRNSIALCQRNVLQIEDIKNYGESDLTTQHLLESMADEAYFPADQQSANF